MGTSRIVVGPVAHNMGQSGKAGQKGVSHVAHSRDSIVTV